ncbi:MAG: NAD(P)/FAD-dependent oxidoreductase [bacterium]
MNKCRGKKEKYVIIGNSVAGIAAIEAIRERDKISPLTVISKEPYLTYSRPLMSYFLEGKVKLEKMYYREKQFYQENNVELILGQEVTKVLPKEKSIVLANKKKISYTKLLIACGGKPIVPAIKGVDKDNVFTFTTWDEVNRLAKAIKKAKKAVVIGGGMIGLKAAESLSNAGLKVTIIELADRVLSTVLDKEGASIVHRHLKENKVELITRSTAEKIAGINKKVEGVILKSAVHADRQDKRIKADLVVVAIGVIPNLDLARETEIRINKGILVNEFVQTNIENIYAAGDVAEAYDFLYRQNRPIPIWPLAYEQGEIAGANMAGEMVAYQGGLVLNSIEVFNLPIITAGISAVKEDMYEILVKFEPEKKTYKRIVIQKGKINGSILINDIERAGIITGLIKDQLDVTNFKNEILEETFGYIYVPKEFRAKEISPLEV